ncbi:TetR/AcrR family transcriptional regulator [Bradyrhizobium sp. Cp5.3]|uniref:TetR/AcrR family transcriptional regulator n=1 Tax=Bradyrhizobium sp. Cp5.3 TaxID=443598 RepID=UPI000411004E|nr:TetR family transcriptional regulator [Bradyrhizobium sp. Cp5.3]
MGKASNEARARILGAAEESFRRVGHHRTSVADIAAELGMSPANIYRFFPSRLAIDESICGRLMNEVADIAVAIARTDAPATEKLDQLLTNVHRHAKMMLVKAKPMHDLIVAATQENWPIIQAHIKGMLMILEAIIRDGADAGEFDVEDAAEAARAVRSALVPFFHPVLIEHRVVNGEDAEAGLRDQIRFILKALGKSG